jgi:phosphoesterase RecJ-like protein
MTIKNNYSKLLELIKQSEFYLLTSHVDPDGDSIGSLIGLDNFLRSLGKQTVIFNEGRLPGKYKFLDPDKKIKFMPEPLPFDPQVVIVLECPQLERIGFVGNLIDETMIPVNIDHHSKNAMFGKINIINESACAVADILYDIIKAGGYEITPDIAVPFYAAIASDTGRFKFPNTDARCFATASELVKAGANPKLISDKIFSSFSAGTIRLLGDMLKRLELYDNGTICVLRLSLADLKRYDVDVEDTEGIIDYSLVIEGVRVGILFKEYDSRIIKVGLRSQNGIDIARFAREKGGGGHPNAAGFTIGEPLNDAVKRVVEEVSEYLHD